MGREQSDLATVRIRVASGRGRDVIVWAGDDFAENDGDPSIDGGGVANPGAGILALRARGFRHWRVTYGYSKRRSGARNADESANLHMLSWHELR